MADPKKPSDSDATSESEEVRAQAVDGGDGPKAALGAGAVEDAVVVPEGDEKAADAAYLETSDDAEKTAETAKADAAPSDSEADAEVKSDSNPDHPIGASAPEAGKTAPGVSTTALGAAAAVGAGAALLLAPVAVSLLPYGAGQALRSADASQADLNAAIEQRVAALEGALDGALADLTTRIDKAAAEVGALAQASEAGDAAAADARGELLSATAQAEETARRVDGRVAALSAELQQGTLAWRGEIDALRRALADLAAAAPAGSFAEAPDGAAPDAGTVGQGVLTRLALLEGGVRRLEARVNMLSPDALPETRADARRISELETRLAALETRPQVTAGGEAAVGVAYAALAQAVAGSSPYDVEAATLEKVAGVTLEPALASRAKTGLPSKVALASEFDEAARDGLRALAEARSVDGEESWTGRLAGRLSSLVIIERAEETGGLEPESVLSRAEARIDEGDVAAALAELEVLPQPAKEGMAPWIARAEARAAAEAALVDLRAKLLGAQ